jgi:chromosome segregation ATPase
VSRVGHALGEEGSRLAELVLTANAATQRDLTALKVEMSELRSEVEETKEGMNGAAQTCHATIDAISETRAAAEAANTAHAVLAAKFDAATTAHAALAAKVAAWDSQLEAALADSSAHGRGLHVPAGHTLAAVWDQAFSRVSFHMSATGRTGSLV